MNLYYVFIFLNAFISLCVIIITQIQESGYLVRPEWFPFFTSQHKHSHAHTHAHKSQTAYLFHRET